MTILQKVRAKYTATLNQPGKLNEWALYLLGMEKVDDTLEVLKAWGKGDFEKCYKYNYFDVLLEYKLYQLILYSIGEVEEVKEYSEEKEHIASEIKGFNIKKVICPFCKASNIIGDKQTKTLCAICGEEFKTQAKYF